MALLCFLFIFVQVLVVKSILTRFCHVEILMASIVFLYSDGGFYTWQVEKETVFKLSNYDVNAAEYIC
jgi:hypothetical protein